MRFATKRFDLWDEWTGSKIHVNERLAEKDMDIFNIVDEKQIS